MYKKYPNIELKKIKKIFRKGNVTRVIVKDPKGNVIVNLPIAATIVGGMISPFLMGLGMILAIAKEYTVYIEYQKK